MADRKSKATSGNSKPTVGQLNKSTAACIAALVDGRDSQMKVAEELIRNKALGLFTVRHKSFKTYVESEVGASYSHASLWMKLAAIPLVRKNFARLGVAKAKALAEAEKAGKLTLTQEIIDKVIDGQMTVSETKDFAENGGTGAPVTTPAPTPEELLAMLEERKKLAVAKIAKLNERVREIDAEIKTVKQSLQP